MEIIDNLIIADGGFLLRKKDSGRIVGKKYLCGYLYYSETGEKIIPPYLENSEDFEEVLYSTAYSALVTEYIREKYSVSDELAIQRQRDEKPYDFSEYFKFCEDCKARAREYIESLDQM